MASKRREIRNKFRDLLLGKTDAGANVFSNRASATWSEELPIIAVYSRAESVEQLNTAPLEYRRVIEMAVEIVAEGSETPGAVMALEDTLDEIAEQVEKELSRDETIGETLNYFGKKVALVDALRLKTIEFDFQGEGVKPTGSAIMLFDVTYYEMRPLSLDEQDGIGTLKTVHTKWEFGQGENPPDDQFEITDDLTIPD